MNLLDSSGRLEFFLAGPRASDFRPVIENRGELATSAVSLYEVLRALLTRVEEDVALSLLAVMERGRVIPLDGLVAREAALVSRAFRLAMADSIIYATARLHRATLWTQDADFDGLPGVRYVQRP